MCEGCGGQHGASEGAWSGCSGVREESQQQSIFRPGSLVLPLQVNVTPNFTAHIKTKQSCGHRQEGCTSLSISAWQVFIKLVVLPKNCLESENNV